MSPKQVVVGLTCTLAALLVACSSTVAGSAASVEEVDAATVTDPPTLKVAEDAGGEATTSPDAAPEASPTTDAGDAAIEAGPQPGDDCTTGARTCNGPTPLACESGKWVAESTCTGATPVCNQGLCVACTTGQKQCVGSTPRSCVAGQWQYEPGCSGANAVCLDGTCVQCSPGEKRCTGSVPEVCSLNGTWQTQPTCSGATPICENATGTCVECVTGTKKCDGLKSMTCNSQKKWEIAQTCQYACGGAGVCGVCEPDSYGCEAPANSSGVTKTCNSEGQWYYSTSQYSSRQDGKLSCVPECSNRAGLKVNDASDTVSDTVSGLTWERHVKYVPGSGYINYADSVAYCTAKGAGWRLPTMAEINALRVNTTTCQFPDDAAFPTISGTSNYNGVWTSESGGGGHVVWPTGGDADANLHNVMCVK